MACLPMHHCAPGCFGLRSGWGFKPHLQPQQFRSIRHSVCYTSWVTYIFLSRVRKTRFKPKLTSGYTATIYLSAVTFAAHDVRQLPRFIFSSTFGHTACRLHIFGCVFLASGVVWYEGSKRLEGSKADMFD